MIMEASIDYPTAILRPCMGTQEMPDMRNIGPNIGTLQTKACLVGRPDSGGRDCLQLGEVGRPVDDGSRARRVRIVHRLHRRGTHIRFERDW